MSGLSAWLTWNWKSIIGLPGPREGEWMVQDTILAGLPRNTMFSVVQKLDNLGVIRRGELGRRVHEDGSMTQQRLWSTERGKWEDILTHNSVNADVFSTLSSDPSADVFLVDVLPSTVSERDVRAAREVLNVDIQAVAVSESDIESYPGEILVVHDVSEWTSIFSRADVLVGSPMLPRWPLALELEGATVVNPGPGGVFKVIEHLVSTNPVSLGGTSGRERSVADSQERLWRWDPTVLTESEVEPDPDEEGQTSLEMLR